MLQSGYRVYHVDNSARVITVTVVKDDGSGVVSVKYANGQQAQVQSFNLFTSLDVANSVAVKRASGQSQGSTRYLR